ncbi:MAG: hypothetical protein ACYC99_13850 [Candidatus Geothermincolia bacterium]
MRRLVGSILVVALLAGLVALVATGCGTSEKAEGTGIITPQGKISIKKTGNSITVTKGTSSKTWTAATASEKALGFPVPSDATLVKGTAVEVSSGSAEKWIGATFYSKDDTSAVINFYKAKLSSMSGFSDTSTTINNQMVGLFSVKSGTDVKSVIIRAAEKGEQGKTWIQIATATGAGV